MTKAYIEGFRKTAEAYGINPAALLKTAGFGNFLIDGRYRVPLEVLKRVASQARRANLRRAVAHSAVPMASPTKGQVAGLIPYRGPSLPATPTYVPGLLPSNAPVTTPTTVGLPR